MSEFSYRGKLPFRIVSSSVNTGYNAELTAAVAQNIEIVNQHRDEYGELQDSPAQGPFTEQWVGGNQHRHIELNAGGDNPSNRPEAFLISGSTNKVRIYGPAHFDINAPKALLTRDNVSKSSVNIKNIRNESRRLGNFSHNYEVVQTSGRNINQSLIENNLTASGVLTTKFIKDVEEYSLPQEPNNKTVFVERFNAPGGKEESSRGALDRESEQYSPNNSLVTRNIKVRQPFYGQLTQHAAQFNSGSTEGITIHAVNRNSIQTIELSGTTFLTASDHDNFWIQHSIPSTDLRYKWIKDSVVNSTTVIQYQDPYDSSQLIFNTGTLVKSGSNNQFQIDNSFINSIVKDKKSINLVTNTFTISQPRLSASFSEIVNTPFGFSTWREIRNGEHPVTKTLRLNNIISVQTPEIPIVNGARTTRKRSNSVTNFTEPPVTVKFKPLVHALKFKEKDKTFYFVSTYGNNRSTVVTPQLKDILNVNENTTQMGNMLTSYYSAIDRSSNPQNPIEKLQKLNYSETLYPREINTYLAETRARTQYVLDQPGTGSRDGYDIQLGTQRAFWRDEQEDRLRSETGFYNSMNYFIQPLQSNAGVEETINLVSPTVYQFPTPPFRRTNSGFSSSFDSSGKILYNSINNFDSFRQSNYGSGTIKLYSYNRYNILNSFEERQIIIKNNIINNSCNGELNTEIFIDNFYSSSIPMSASSVDSDLDDNSPGTTRQLTRTTQYSNILQYNPELDQLSFGYTSYSSYSSSLPSPKPNYLAFIGGFESGSRDYSDNLDNIYNSQPTGEILSTLDSGLRYASESFGDKKPWFDSYEKYSDDIRSYAKDHSILPEFRISSNIPFYVTENGGNFRIKNSSYLEIDGVGENYRSSFTASSIAYNKIFINSYATTDIFDNEELQKENSSLLKLQNIKFSVSGIKKLLPYNGFYPKDRTIQLANLFNNFLDNNVGGGYYSYIKSYGFNSATQKQDRLVYNIDDSGGLWSKNIIMPYFFAPGILYNTFKSGISVDFPQITASSNYTVRLDKFDDQPSYIKTYDQNILNVSMLSKDTSQINSTEYYRIDSREFFASYLRNGSINGRVPFESIIFPESFIPIVSFNTSSFSQTATTPTQRAELEDFYKKYVKGSLLPIKFDATAHPEHFVQISYDGITNDLISQNMVNFGPFNKIAIPFAFLKNDRSIDPSYSMAMSNFLAEIPRFFLKNSSMNVFKSAELKDWKTFEVGKKYYLDLKMKKSSDLVMIESYRSDAHITGSSQLEKTFNGRYFGWPVSKVKTQPASCLEQDILFETTFLENEIINNNENSLTLVYNTALPQNSIIFNSATNTITIRTAGVALSLQDLVDFVNNDDNWLDIHPLLLATANVSSNPIISGFTTSLSNGEARTIQDDYVVHNDPAYAPFTPPYFEGEAILRFELSASKTQYDSVADMLSEVDLVNIFNSLGEVIDTGSEAFRNKMSIEDCMYVLGIGQNPITTFAGPNSPSSFEQVPNISKQYWAISPKLETPVLDFSEQEFAPHTGSYWVSSGYGRGMWSGYGKIPTGSKGITIEIAESFPLQNSLRRSTTFLGAINLQNKTGSLLDQVGFKAESAKIGRLAETKTISEGIVLIPYVDGPIQDVTTQIDNHHFFLINPETFSTLKQQVGSNSVESETSITKMIRSMNEYVIPPNFNFLKYDNINPFVMYLFEFKHDLDQQDLADIWQGVMPKIATTAENDIVTFNHPIGENELFGADFKAPENMRWLVFKVKKKAEWNYFAITEDINDDQNFVFKFSNSEKAKTPDYSYNWPYDYFSLVELAKVDITLSYEENLSGSVPLQQSITLITNT